MTIKPPVDFTTGLTIPSPPINLVTLALLEQAGHNASDVGIVAASSSIVQTMITLWLTTPDTAVAEKSRQVLSLLLSAENPELPSLETQSEGPLGESISETQGLMWRRVTQDRDIYELFFEFCSMSEGKGKPLGKHALTKNQKTVAQARLLDFLLQFSLAPQFYRSQIPEVERSYHVNGGLLTFASKHMVDTSDVLSHVNLLMFFTKFVSQCSGDIIASDPLKASGISRGSSKPLDFMLSTGLHEKVLSYCLNAGDLDPVDKAFIYGEATRYVAAYASHHHGHFLYASQADAKAILQHLYTSLCQMPNPPDLSLLASLPRTSLLPNPEFDSPLLCLKTKPPNANVFDTLAMVFGGTPCAEGTNLKHLLPRSQFASSNKEDPPFILADKAAARALFLLYTEQNKNFWQDLISAAEVLAVSETALAAISLLRSIIDSEWAASPESPISLSHSLFQFPTEPNLVRKCRSYTPLPLDGAEAVLQSPGREHVIPYLLRGVKGSGAGVYEIAGQKHDALGALLKRVEEKMEGGEGDRRGEDAEAWGQIAGVLRQRVRQGVFGGSGGGSSGASGGPANVVVATMGR